MPTYQFRCQECETEFEDVHRMSEPHPEECPACKGPVKQIITGGLGFQLKGYGWFGKETVLDEIRNSNAEQQKRDDKRDWVEHEQKWDEKEKYAFEKVKKADQEKRKKAAEQAEPSK